MKTVLQDLSNGETSLVDVPSPQSKSGHIIVESSKSLISVGTEKMLINFGKSNLLEKARSQPEKVKQVLDRVKSDGIYATYEAVKSKLDEKILLGYSNVGNIIDSSNTDFQVGQRVVSNGNHAEIIRVPKNLATAIPDNVDDDTASFTVISSIALQGIRLAKPSVGENVVVIGLGLIGILAVQILKANGCEVLGLDLDASKCKLAEEFGAITVNISEGVDAIESAKTFSNGFGVDAVLITASSKSNEIVSQAAQMCRKRGRIILIGVVGLTLNRAEFYEKELSFQVSCSYGPGRYDPIYEQEGIDYPIGFVRWTEKRNFDAVLNLMSAGKINTKPLISYQYDIDQVKEAYKKLDEEKSLGILINYSSKNKNQKINQKIQLNDPTYKKSAANVSFIGAGNYASRVLIPAFKNAGVNLNTIVTSNGVSATNHGKKYKFKTASTNIIDALSKDTDTVVIATQHHLHAKQTMLSMKKGKNIFLEKPLAINSDEICDLENAMKSYKGLLMVGYNRRFSPHVKKIKKLLSLKKQPKVFIMTMNAGSIDPQHWTQDKQLGGGRIIGEACHYIDLMRFLAASKIKSFNAIKMEEGRLSKHTNDKCIISLEFEDGSIGSIHYLANGGKLFPKERVEIFCENSVLQLDNFLKLKGFNWPSFANMNIFAQDKGQNNCVRTFVKAVKDGTEPPIPYDEIFEVARVTTKISEMIENK